MARKTLCPPCEASLYITIHNRQCPHSAINHDIIQLRKRQSRLLLFPNNNIIHNLYRNHPVRSLRLQKPLSRVMAHSQKVLLP